MWRVYSNPYPKQCGIKFLGYAIDKITGGKVVKGNPLRYMKKHRAAYTKG
jgi:hypothetical protein